MHSSPLPPPTHLPPPLPPPSLPPSHYPQGLNFSPWQWENIRRRCFFISSSCLKTVKKSFTTIWAIWEWPISQSLPLLGIGHIYFKYFLLTPDVPILVDEHCRGTQMSFCNVSSPKKLFFTFFKQHGCDGWFRAILIASFFFIGALSRYEAVTYAV